MALVLCAGTDDALQSSRVLLLEHAGHTVVPVTGEDQLIAQLIAACERQQFDVVVIGQRITGNEKQRALRLVKEHCPKVKVLELVEYGKGKVLAGADDWLEVPATAPPELAHRVSLLAANRR